MRATIPFAAFVLVTLTAWMCSFAAAPHAAPAAPSQPTTAGPSHAAPADDAHAPAANQAVLPPPGIRWPAVMVIIVLGMFLAALIIGPVVRMNMPEEVPVSHTHDEKHGHDRDHGHDPGAGRARVRPLHPGDRHDSGHGGHH